MNLFSSRRPLHRLPSRQQQRGAVLIVGLIILVVLTLLGVQGMRTNLVQERMASNMRERNVAFQAAETALRVGESSGPFVPTNDGLESDWSNATGIAGFDDVAADPVFHVGPPERIRVGLTLPAEFRYIYPVASRGVGRQDGSVVELQSGFEPVN
jgi:type IV pilus assembly protein PilX